MREMGDVSAEALSELSEVVGEEARLLEDGYERDVALVAAALAKRAAKSCVAGSVLDDEVRSWAMQVSWDRGDGQISVCLSHPEMLRFVSEAVGGVERAVMMCARTSLKSAAEDLAQGIRRSHVLGEEYSGEVSTLYEAVAEVFMSESEGYVDLLAERIVRIGGIPESEARTWMKGVNPRVVARGAGMTDFEGDLFFLLAGDSANSAKTVRDVVEVVKVKTT